MLEDSTKAMTIVDLVANPDFSKPESKTKQEINIDFTSSVYWLKLEINNRHDKVRTAVLEVKIPTINKIILFTG